MKYMVETMNIDFQQKRDIIFNKHFNLSTLPRLTTEPSSFLQQTLQSHYITSIFNRKKVRLFNKHINLITLLRITTEPS